MHSYVRKNRRVAYVSGASSKQNTNTGAALIAVEYFTYNENCVEAILRRKTS